MATMGYLGVRGMAAAAALAVLAGCSNTDTASEAGGKSAGVSDETLAQLVADDDDLSIVSGALNEAGLGQVFEGAAAYTLLAPEDAAFDKLGEASADLRTPEQRPAMVAILRDHIVPGYLTPEDIENAIKLSDDKSVEMKTMGDHTLTFTGGGDAITVTSEDGAVAHIAGDALRGSNGVAIPLDGLLKTAAAPARASAR